MASLGRLILGLIAAAWAWLRRRPAPAASPTAPPRRPISGWLFGGHSERPIRATVTNDDAPMRPRPAATPLPPIDSGAAIGSGIRAMRRAAVIDMFDQVGLELVPGQLWRFVEDGVDVGQAVTDFLTQLGLDALAVRRGDRAELARANDVLELLVRGSDAFTRLSPEAVARIEKAIFSGDYDRVRGAVEIVSIYESIVRLGDRWSADARFVIFEEFLGTVAGELADPLAATLDDARTAEAVADRMAGLMDRLDHGRQLHALWRDTLRNLDRGSWEGWPEADEIRRGVVQFENLAESLRTRLFDLDEVAELIAKLEEINTFLERTIKYHAARKRKADAAGERARAGAGGRSSAGGGKRSSAGAGSSGRRRASTGGASILTELEKALIHFGFARADRPSWKKIRKRWIELLRKIRADINTDPDTTAAAQMINNYHDILKREFAA